MSDIFSRSLTPAPDPIGGSIFDRAKKEADEYSVAKKAIQDRIPTALPVADWEYDIINRALTASKDPEGDAYKWATAIQYSRFLEKPIDDVIANFDAYNEFWMGKKYTSPKDNWAALADSLKIGPLLLQQAQITRAWMKSGGMDKKLEAQADAIQEQIDNHSNYPKPWLTEAVQYGAAPKGLFERIGSGISNFAAGAADVTLTSGPISTQIAGAGIIAGAAATAAGITAAAAGGATIYSGGALSLGAGAATVGMFTAGASAIGSFQEALRLTEGLEYYRMRKNGTPHDVAAPIAGVSGAVQAAIDSLFGLVPGIVGKVGGQTVETLTGNIVKRLAISGKWGSAAKALTEYMGTATEEGVTEGLQQLTSIGADATAAELSKNGMEPLEAEEIARQVWDNAKGGFMAALIMGIPGSVIGYRGDAREAKFLKATARAMEEDAFIAKALGSDLTTLEGMPRAQQVEALKAIYAAQEKTRTASTAAGLDVSDAPDVVLTPSKSRLSFQSTESEGTQQLRGTTDTAQVVNGQKPATVWANYTVDEESKTVKVSTVQVAQGLARDDKTEARSQIGAAMLELRQQYDGYAIEWAPKGQGAAWIRNEIERQNPRFFEADYKAAITANRLEAQIQSVFSPESRVESKVYMDLLAGNERRRAAAEGRAFDLDRFVAATFTKEGITGDLSGLSPEARSQIAAEEASGNFVKGATLFIDQRTGNIINPENVKAIREHVRAAVYLTSRADAGTVLHELVHVLEAMEDLDETEKTALEKHFGKKYEKFGRKEREDLAYAAVNYAKHGNAPEGLQGILGKLLELLQSVITASQSEKAVLSPELKEFYRSFFTRGEAGKAAIAQAKATQAEVKAARKSSQKKTAGQGEAQAPKAAAEEGTASPDAATGQEILFERDVERISYKFPAELKGYSDIHSTAQISGILNFFGRGVIDRTGIPNIGDAGSSHVGLSAGMTDAKRFYYGYSKDKGTFYLVSKNGMDDAYFQNPKVQQVILSKAFNKYRLQVKPGKKLQFGDDIRSVTEGIQFETEPAIPEGMTRLYRGETDDPNATLDTPEWMRDRPDVIASREANGRWFSSTRELAEYYVDTFGLKDDRVSYVDIPTSDLEKYRASNNLAGAFSAPGLAEEEFFVPREVADSRILFEEDDIEIPLATKDNSFPKDVMGGVVYETLLNYHPEKQTTYWGETDPRITPHEWEVRSMSEDISGVFPSYEEAIAFLKSKGFDWIASNRDGAIEEPLYDNWNKVPMAAYDHSRNLAIVNREARNYVEAEENKIQALIQGGKKVYVRYGDIPEGGRSKNWADGTYEDGVSVFNGVITESNKLIILTTTNQEKGTLLAMNDRPLYILEGNVISSGSDGEPVLEHGIARRWNGRKEVGPTILFEEDDLANEASQFSSRDEFIATYEGEHDEATLGRAWDDAHSFNSPDIRSVEAANQAFLRRLGRGQTLEAFLEGLGARLLEEGRERGDLVEAQALRQARGTPLSDARRGPILKAIERQPSKWRSRYAEIMQDRKMLAQIQAEKAGKAPLEYDIAEPDEDLDIVAHEARLRAAIAGLNPEGQAEFLDRKVSYGEAMAEERQVEQDTQAMVADLAAKEKALAEFRTRYSPEEKRIARLTQEVKALEKDLAAKKVQKKAGAYRGAPIEELQAQIDDRRAAIKERIRKLSPATVTRDVSFQAAKKAVAETRVHLKEIRDRAKAKKAQRDLMIAIAKSITRAPSYVIDWKIAQQIRTIQQAIDPHFRRKLEGWSIEELRKIFKEGPGIGQILPPEVVERLHKRPLNDWTMEELRDLEARVDALRELGASLYATRLAERNLARYDLQAALVKTIGASGKLKVQEPYGSKEFREQEKKDNSVFLKFDLGLSRMMEVAETLDHGLKGSFYTSLVLKEREAYAAEKDNLDRRWDALTKRIEELKLDVKAMYEGDIKVGEKSYSRWDVMGMYIGMQEPDTADAIIYGNLMNLDQREKLGDMDFEVLASRNRTAVEKATMELTIPEKELAAAFIKDGNENFERLAEATYQYENRMPEQVGVYFPHERRMRTGEGTLQEQQAEDLLNRSSRLPRGVGKQPTIERIKIGKRHQSPIVLDALAVYRRGIQRQEHYINYAGWVQDMNKVYLDPRAAQDTRYAIKQSYGQGYIEYIDRWIKESANPRAFDEPLNPLGGVDKVFRILRGPLGVAYLGFRASTAFKQLVTSPVPYLPYAPGFMVRRMMMNLNPAEMMKTIKFAREKSAIVRHRQAQLGLDEVRKLAESNTAAVALKKAATASMKLIEWADLWSVSTGWMAIYEKTVAGMRGSGLSAEQIEAKAIQEADDVTTKTQPTSRAADLSPLFKSESSVIRFLTQFKTPLNVIYNQVFHNFGTDLKNGHAGRAFGILAGYIFTGVVLSLLAAPRKDDDDDSQKLKAALAGALKMPFDTIPIGGELVAAALQRLITGNPGPMSSSIFPGVDKLLTGATGAITADTQEAALKNFLKFLEGTGMMVGLPTSAAKEYYRAIFEGDIAALIGRPKE